MRGPRCTLCGAFEPDCACSFAQPQEASKGSGPEVDPVFKLVVITFLSAIPLLVVVGIVLKIAGIS